MELLLMQFYPASCHFIRHRRHQCKSSTNRMKKSKKKLFLIPH
jgi:hypothetical protein